MILNRRSVLSGLTASITVGGASLAFTQAATRKRFVVIILRGAMDGLSMIVPYGDYNLREWRASLMMPEPQRPNGLLDLGGFWGLHPAMPQLHALYRAGEVLPIHAVAGPTHSRSHFEAQDLLEFGAEQRITSGWLNRLAGALPANGPTDNAIALGQNIPLILQGPTAVASWSPGGLPHPDANFYQRLLALHSGDPLTGPALADGLREREFYARALSGPSATAGTEPPFVNLARTAGRLLADANGPRLAALDLEGWDTHSGQIFRLPRALALLDAGLSALREGLGASWQETVVLVVTEFGRTVRVNGTGGTDHGTASAALLLGGRVNGGRVQADWPGLGADRLFENRDLHPTADLRSIAKGILQVHFDVELTALTAIFPNSGDVTPMTGLLRS
jgi:uncharacterized protein (DUF1501 family)